MDAEGRRLLARLPALIGATPAVLVTVLRAAGSAPRGPGARMLVRDGRLLAGTIGGGHLEARALAIAAEVQAAGVASAERFALGPELAQCCGGAVTLGFEPIDAAEAARRAAGDELHTEVQGVTLHERRGEERCVVVFGAGHVARALAQVLAALPWRVVVVDGRPEFADAAAFPAGTEVVAMQPAALLRAWGWPGPATQPATQRQPAPRPPPPDHTAALVMTHDHALDRALCLALLATADPSGAPLDYVGLIGSKTKIAGTRRQLEAHLPAAACDRLVAPIGLRLPEGGLLGGKLPGEIAVSVAAQLVARWQATS